MTNAERKPTTKYYGRLLGSAFLVVMLASLFSRSAVFESRFWSGSYTENMLNIAENVSMIWSNILGELITSIGIIVLASLLYFILHEIDKFLALVALGWWIAEAITLAVSRIYIYSLVNVSQEFAAAGAPTGSHYQTLGSVYFQAAEFSYALHMLFFCLGAILWYTLLYRSRYIPRWLSLWGIIAVSIALIATQFAITGIDLPFFVYLPYAPFELVLGVWLLVKGFFQNRSVQPEG